MKKGKYPVMQGFTLIELMVSMLIASVILLGLYSSFVLQSRVQDEQATQSLAMEDIQIAAQIMQRELKMAQANSIVWAGNRLQYTDVDGNSGSFWYNFPVTGGGMLGPGTICWDRPAVADNTCDGNEELLRGLAAGPIPNGMSVALNNNGTAADSTDDIWTITLTASYLNQAKQIETMPLVFNVWARN
jgi:prepilin-type N-terminal cleavage/methylation domain-containing protein